MDLFDEVTEFVNNLLRVHLLSFMSGRLYRRFLALRWYGERPLCLSSFAFIKLLGEGGFGRVYAVRKRDTKYVIATATNAVTGLARDLPF